MGKSLKIHLANAHPSLVHDFRNFGEDVYCEFREQYDISIDEIDASTEEFHLRGIPKREFRTARALVRQLAERYPALTLGIDETP